MIDFESVAKALDDETRLQFLQAMKILSDLEVFDFLIRANKAQLVDGGIGWSHSDEIIVRVQELTQTNRTLLILGESAKHLTKGMSNA